jgi:DNA-binding MarR family transcriptional regulator
VPELLPLFSDLVRLEIELWDALDARLRRELGIPLGNLDVMRVIDRTPSCRVHDIASQLSLTVGGTSKAVDRIEAAGHCVRQPNPGDRRSSIIELTPAGARLLAQAVVLADRELAVRLGEPLSASELAQLASTITKLRAARHG